MLRTESNEGDEDEANAEDDAHNDEEPGPSTRMAKKPKTISKSKRAFVRCQKVQRLLIGQTEDLEAGEQEIKNKKSGGQRKPITIPPVKKLPSQQTGRRNRGVLPPNYVEKFINPPGLKVKGTWNYFYNGTGACDWIHDRRTPQNKHLFVGNGTKLRKSKIRFLHMELNFKNKEF